LASINFFHFSGFFFLSFLGEKKKDHVIMALKQNKNALKNTKFAPLFFPKKIQKKTQIMPQ
jgi:hypothetical protein